MASLQGAVYPLPLTFFVRKSRHSGGCVGGFAIFFKTIEIRGKVWYHHSDKIFGL